MYIPTAFAIEGHAEMHALMRGHSFATLITTDADGTPFATHLPFLLDTGSGDTGTLRAHMARANPQWRHFRAGHQVLVIFQGPHAYISPSC